MREVHFARRCWAVVLLGLLLLGACRPEIEGGQFQCDPEVPGACPPGLVCLALGGDSYCFPPDSYSLCGNGTLEPGEECDDGNTASLDGCSGECVTERCGNGELEPATGEECDDGNRLAGDGCSPWCKVETCGDGVVAYDTGEECDDAGFLSHDGCSSGCTAELPYWKLWQPPLAGEVQHPNLAYDESRHVTVWFGGSRRGQTSSETWVKDDSGWRRLSPLVSPPPRRASRMVYDSDREVMVLYGGWNPNANPPHVYDDTWELDVATETWTERITAESPPQVVGACLTYDASRQRVVLFGGGKLEGPIPSWTGTDWVFSDETWEYDGTNWNKIELSTSPSARYGAACAFDRRTGRTVLQGGTGDDSTYEYDGQEWTAFFAQGPAISWAYAMYDWERESVLLVGGCDGDSDCSARPWVYDSAARLWSRLQTTGGPVRLDYHGAAYDVDRGRVVVFGGQGIAPAETWELVDTTWVNRTVPIGPPPRDGYGLAHDLSRGVTVLFGGVDATGMALVDTWEYDGDRWITLNPALSPSGRVAPSMAYDPVNAEVVLFGGLGGSGSLEDTWTWDGVAWNQKSPVHSPGRRHLACMAFDPLTEQILLHGGRWDDSRWEGSLRRNDTWSWDGADWTRLTAAHLEGVVDGCGLVYDSRGEEMVLYGLDDVPRAYALQDDNWAEIPTDGMTALGIRFGWSLTYNEDRGRALLVGGSAWGGSDSALFELDGTSWSEVVPAVSPEIGVQFVRTVYDPRRRAIIYAGGIGQPQGEVWEFAFRSGHPDEDCENGTDDDADGLADCADPDCDHHPACAAP